MNQRQGDRRELWIRQACPGPRRLDRLGNVSHRVPSIHPMIAFSAAPRRHPQRRIRSDANSQRATKKKTVIDGAKGLAMTTLDSSPVPRWRGPSQGDFAKERDLSRAASSSPITRKAS